METITYFLLPRQKEQNISEDFKKLLSWLEGQEAEITKEDNNRYKIKYSDRPHVAHLQVNAAQGPIALASNGRIALEVTRADSYSIHNIKKFALDVGYRIYSLELNSFLPAADFIRDLVTLTLSPELQKVFALYNFEPLFMAEAFNYPHVFYGRVKGQEAVHIVNPFLLNYHLAWNDASAKSDEFSYEVAPNIERFVQYMDRDLISSHSFYENYGKDQKIINFSGVNIDNPSRKLFVKPLIMQIDDEDYRFFTKQGERGAMILMDKIRSGETLDITLNRILKEWGVADGYLRAFVRREVEYDKDRDGLITPRIIVNVYVEKLLKKPEGSERNWDPIETKDINKSN